MKNIFKRLMNFSLIIFTGIGVSLAYAEFKEEFLIEWIIGIGIFFGIMGGLNYVFFGKFTLWNKKDETE